jgi:outer membrane biosynthesis protein TonB
MLGNAQDLSTRIVSSRRLMARTALVVVLAMLLGAATAQADENASGENAAGPPAEVNKTEAPASSGAAGTPEGTVVGEGGAAPEGTGEQAVPHSETPTEPAPPPAGEPVSATPPPPPPAETPPPPAETPPAQAETPAPPISPAPTETPAPAPERPTSEALASEAPSHAKSDEKSAVMLPALSDTVPPAAAAEAATAASPGVPTGSMVIDLGEAQVAGESSAGAHRAAAVNAAGSGKDSNGCGLQGLGGVSGAGCVGTWLRVPGPLSPAQVSLSPVAAALGGVAVTAGGGAGTDDRPGAAGGGRSMPPAPGPAPGGASGVAAGGGGAGVGLSGFLTFALLLALAAPRAMRRLRLACLPWRTAFFVLIPERPG